MCVCERCVSGVCVCQVCVCVPAAVVSVFFVSAVLSDFQLSTLCVSDAPPAHMDTHTEVRG